MAANQNGVFANKDDRAAAHQETVAGMSWDMFFRLRNFIYSESGIKLSDVKKTMLESRLQKRLRALKMNFAEYCDYVLSPEGNELELTNMIDQVTTNKTDFFREPAHFEYLISIVVPALSKSQRHLTIWSAGCSSGEEPYTLAMVMQNYIDKGGKAEFSILATDISTRVLEKARLAVYDQERISVIPQLLQKKYLLRSKDKSSNLYRIVPELRRHVQFRRINFMEGDFGFREELNIIFCRNVIIYFDKQTQERLLRKFCNCLTPGGHIFMGHSETILGMDLPLVQVAPTVYRCSR